MVGWCALARARWPGIAGRSRGPERQRRGRRSRRADLGGSRTGPRPAESQRSGDSAIATRLGLWVRFSDWSDGGVGRPAIPTEWKEENTARGPESARSHKRWGLRRSVEGSPPARRRRARALTRRDRGTLAFRGLDGERPWPRSQTADGGRARARARRRRAGYPRRMRPRRVAQSMRTASGFSTRTWRTWRLSQIASCSSSQS